jgi:two-component system sensor histidine kinase UhpB
MTTRKSMARQVGGRMAGFGLYTRVFVVNAAILIVAVSLLAFTPVAINSDTTNQQLAVLAAGLLVTLLANALLLRLSLRPLRRLKDLMLSVDMLHPGARLDPTGTAEVSSVIRVFNTAIDRLEDERRSSMHRILTAQEQERRRVAQELHDEIGQKLTAVVLELGQAIERLPGETAALADAQELTRESLNQLSLISHQLRPPLLDDLGLVSALSGLCSGMARRTAIDVRFDAGTHLEPLPADVELAVYRVAQEALTNAIRHAGCSTVMMSLTQTPSDLTLRVRDDGDGTNGRPAGAGVRGMRERALAIGAGLTLRSRPGRGVDVSLRVPVDDQARV